MNLAIDCLPVAFLILSIAPYTESQSNYVVDTTATMNANHQTIVKALQNYGYDPMKLPDATESLYEGKPILTNGVINGASNQNVCSTWTLTYSGNTARHAGRLCAELVTGTFDYTNKATTPNGKCKLDVIMTNVTADMSVLFTMGKNTLSDPRVTFTRIGKVQMFLDKCRPDFQRSRLTANLENFYRSKIMLQVQANALRLGTITDMSAPVVNFYTKFVESFKKNNTSTNELE